MDEALMKELEDLRAENEILRASFEEIRKEDPKQEALSLEALLKEISSKLNLGLEQAKECLKEPTDKACKSLEAQMKANPIPLLLTAFGLGYLISRLLDRR
jgi:F0F1-type ATP synthase membrane subunit b/b'